MSAKGHSTATVRLHIAITVFVMAFIFVQSALPGHVSGSESGFIVSLLNEMTGVDFDVLSVIVRKTAHFTEYMILGICLAVNAEDWMKRSDGSLPAWRAGSLSWLAGTLYAVTDEIHQAFVPDRACAATDVMIDSASVAAGVIVAAVIRWLRTRR